MLYTNNTEKLLGLQGVNVKKVEDNEKSVLIYAELERKKQKCPCCGESTDKIHDYREQTVKDIPAFGKLIVLKLRKRRYRCDRCGKRFFEENHFLPRYYRMTNRLAAYVIDKLRDERSFTGVSREVDLSVSTVIRIFDLVSYPKSRLPQVLSIDEFKGNTWGEKYQCILTDPVNKVVLDILPKRYEHYLSSYFNGFSREERSTVKYFVSDMWKPYSLVCDSWFRNAVPVIDKYHWIRQAIWAFEKVRKEEQKKLSPELRKYFKRSRSLLLKRYDGLNDEQKQEVNVMLYYSANISRAHWYKEQLQKILVLNDPSAAKKALIEWMDDTEDSELPDLKYCANTLRSWSAGIINSFFTTVTNGFTEGCNNKIKVLKRNAYGYKNFNRFRNRILHIFSHQSA